MTQNPVAIPIHNCYPARRSRHFISVQVNIILVSHFIFPLNWRRGCSLFFSFIFSFFLEGKDVLPKILINCFLVFMMEKMVYLFYSYIRIKMAARDSGVESLGPCSFPGFLKCSRASGVSPGHGSPRAQNTHTSCLVCAPCRAQTSRAVETGSNQRRLPAAFLAGSACWFFSRDWLLC